MLNLHLIEAGLTDVIYATGRVSRVMLFNAVAEESILTSREVKSIKDVFIQFVQENSPICLPVPNEPINFESQRLCFILSGGFQQTDKIRKHFMEYAESVDYDPPAFMEFVAKQAEYFYKVKAGYFGISNVEYTDEFDLGSIISLLTNQYLDFLMPFLNTGGQLCSRDFLEAVTLISKSQVAHIKHVLFTIAIRFLGDLMVSNDGHLPNHCTELNDMILGFKDSGFTLGYDNLLNWLTFNILSPIVDERKARTNFLAYCTSMVEHYARQPVER